MSQVLGLMSPFPLLAAGILGVHDPVTIGVAVFLALAPALAPRLVFGRSLQGTLVDGALILLVTSALASMGSTYDATLSLPVLLTLLGSTGLFFAITNSPGLARWVGRGLVMGAGLLAIYFVSQYAHFNYQDETGLPARLGQITGSLMPDLVFFSPHPNAVATFLEGALLLSLVLTRQAKGGQRLAWGLAVLVISYGLIVSGSRGAWTGLALALGFWGLLRFCKQPLPLTLAGTGIMAGGLFGAYVVDRLVLSGSYIRSISSLLSTAESRFTLYQNSLYLLKAYPFTGIGLGDTFAMVYSRYQLFISDPFFYYAHNLFLSVGLGQGLLGLAALAWLLCGFYRFVIRVERAGGQNWPSQRFFRAAWLGVTATLIHGLTDSSQFSRDYWTMPMLFALLGLTVVLGRPRWRPARLPENDTGSIARPRRWVTSTVTVLGLILASLIFWRPLAGAWYANMGAVYQTRAELSPHLNQAGREAALMRAAASFEHALELNPRQPVANQRLGLMALDQGDFKIAARYLEQAYRQEPENQFTIKVLGYAYLWSGQLDRAEMLFRRVKLSNRLIAELQHWRRRWQAQNRADLSIYADQMFRRLSAEVDQ